MTLEPDGQEFRIRLSALTSSALVPNLDQFKFAEIVGAAEKICPVSKALNATITLDATLV